MNPYNFVRIRPMAPDARQKPLGHKKLVSEYEGEAVFNGRLHLTLTAFGPIFIPSPFEHETQVARNGHKTCRHFFHYPDDPHPVIPGSTLKGMVRAVAEAASNSCLSVLNETYIRRWDDFEDSYYPSLHFCGGLDTDGKLCPTCRIFGTAPEKEGGSSKTGETPQAFQGKVRFSDAHFVGEFDESTHYDETVTLIPLLEPKVSEKVWYHDPTRNISPATLAGRKFYYHHDSLKAKPYQKQNPDDNEKKPFNQTVRPLKRGATFSFTVDFHNLRQHELVLLLYALELEPAETAVNATDNSVTFEWKRVKSQNGVYHKIGAGKPAGLGSVSILVQQTDLMNVHTRYTGGEGVQLIGSQCHEFVKKAKKQFIKRHQAQPYLKDFRNLLRFPTGITELTYPTIKEFQRKYKGTNLPLPRQESKWEDL